MEFWEDGEDVVADAGNNADLYAANQGSSELINEAHAGEAPYRYVSWVKIKTCLILVIVSRLVSTKCRQGILV